MSKYFTKLRVTSFALLSLFVTSFAMASIVEAAPYDGTIYGRATWRGYFTNRFEDQGREVLPPSSGANGLAIPHTVNSVNGLINHLRSAYNSSNAQRTTGSAFIVHTMLGRNGNQASRTVTAGDWNELTKRMNDRQSKGRIAWTGNVSGWINSYYQPNSNDAAFYRDWRSEAGITFRDDDGRIIYRLIRRCANPIGDGARGLPEVNEWQVRDDSFIQRADNNGNPTGDSLGSTVNNARPGERYVFNHRVTNQGPDALDRNITTWRSYNYPGNSNSRTDVATGGNNTGANQQVRTVLDNTGIIPATAAGQQWCSRIHAEPRAYNNTARLNGNQLCVNVPYAYDLTPHVSVGGDLGTNVEQGSTGTTVDTRVDNEGPTQSRNSIWQLIRFEVAPDAPGSTISDRAGNNDNNGCDTHNPRAGVGNCSVVQDGSGQVFNVGNTELDRYMHDTGDTAIGSRICFVLSVSTPTAAANPSWGHSQPACIMVVKKPKIQVQGGDLWAGRQFQDDNTEREPANITTGTSTIQGTTYGSWGEYGIFATGSISGIASGAGIAGGRPQSEAVARNLNRLTFANTPAYGAYTTNPSTIPDYAGIYGGDNGRGVSSELNLGSADGSYFTDGNVTITGGDNVPKGRDIVIHANNVTINSPISYTDGYANLQEIPRVIIIAEGNVSISPGVERVDAWVVAKDTLYTCNQRAELTIDVCDRQIVFNGPVAANEVSLRRTHGSDTPDERERPAEVFNLRPDAMLSAYQSAVGGDRAQTVHQIELPPRF